MILGTFKKLLFTGAIFERIFPPRGEPYDFANSCFVYTFGSTFMPPIRFGGVSLSNSNQFLPHCEYVSLIILFQMDHKSILLMTLKLDLYARMETNLMATVLIMRFSCVVLMLQSLTHKSHYLAMKKTGTLTLQMLLL